MTLTLANSMQVLNMQLGNNQANGKVLLKIFLKFHLPSETLFVVSAAWCIETLISFFKIWANPGLFFINFRPFHITNQLQIEKA